MDELYYKSVDLLKQLIATKSLSREEVDAAQLIEEYFKLNGFAPQRHGNNVWAIATGYDKKGKLNLSRKELLLKNRPKKEEIKEEVIDAE